MGKEKASINKDMLIRRIHASDNVQNLIIKNNRITLDLLRNIYDELENQLVKAMSEVTVENTADNPIVIRLFEGMNIECYYKPEKETILNFLKHTPNDGLTTIKSRVGVRISTTRHFKEKLAKINNDFKVSLESLD